MRENPLSVKRSSFQMLSFYCQSISFGLQMKSFVVQREYNFEYKRKQIVLKINKFVMLRLSEAMENEVMWIKMVCFGIRNFQNFYVAL